MTVDEYETIRLIDFGELTQEQCVDQMEIARTTAQAIYASARKKLAECIAQGWQVRITSGDVQVSEKRNKAYCRHCERRGGMEENHIKKRMRSLKPPNHVPP